ncbi:type II toxin-antitoxin system YafQ family toxin [Hallerella succinigenes]|uniref:mRNA interferase YafQ n=1 Tax=Hallerella succinigenes TaxID=1896222 RepID=A0A2M9A7V2_9BACT|nr:type II toxin-antitoxin system YafQ family toxin [Hallerella succinigenes]PJJ41800.1 mRNA interferase YafQ [Hallerella succinigenes]
MVEKGPRYKILWTSQYKKDVKRAKKRNYDMKELYAVVSKLANDEPLEDKYRDHALGGNWSEHRELHIKPDWLLIYRKQDNVLILELVRTGTHSDLFEK